MTNDLLQQIDDLVASKTFNLDALDGIKTLKDSLKKTLEERDTLKKNCEMMSKDNLDRHNEIERIRGINKNLEDQITQLKAGELKAKEAVWEKLIAEAKATAYEDALKTVFRPATVRETVYQSIPLSQSSNGNTYVSPYQQETKTTKEEL